MSTPAPHPSQAALRQAGRLGRRHGKAAAYWQIGDSSGADAQPFYRHLLRGISEADQEITGRRADPGRCRRHPAGGQWRAPGPHNEGMRLLRPASEDDMVAIFLAAEVTSEGYGPQIRGILTRLGQPRGIVEQPDTRDEAANAVRRQVLAAYRDYPAGDVFTGMPADVRWHHAALTPAELATVRYIDYPYWTDFSGGTRLAADGARRLGPWQHMQPGTIYRQIAENLRDGQLPPALILLGEPGLANLVVIEGHKRLTGLLLCPQWLPAELDVLLGITASHRK